MRARKARLASDGEHVLVDERCILCVPRDVVAVDLVSFGHLGVEVARVAQTGRRVDVRDGDGCCVEQLLDQSREECKHSQQEFCAYNSSTR